MTPTEAREFMAGTFGPARARTVITKLADQVEALTKERDALIVALKFVESVYRQNCVAVGEPSSTLDYLQSVIAKAGVQ